MIATVISGIYCLIYFILYLPSEGHPLTSNFSIGIFIFGILFFIYSEYHDKKEFEKYHKHKVYLDRKLRVLFVNDGKREIQMPTNNIANFLENPNDASFEIKFVNKTVFGKSIIFMPDYSSKEGKELLENLEKEVKILRREYIDRKIGKRKRR
ncbi:MAG: hypothetical protein KDC84_14390 [Crocinitomicaceae bacterium]|nr:hypothetical protein [Crocinitomicaceae bacterium]